MSESIFSKIIRRELPADIVYEDEDCIVFKDIQPKAPFHVLIVPKKEMTQLSYAQGSDQALLGKLLLTANQVAADAGYAHAFRVLINNGAEAGQEVFHLHLHLLAGM